MFGFSFDGGRASENLQAHSVRFKEELVSLAVPCQGPGAPKSGFRNFHWLRGGFIVFFPAIPHNAGYWGWGVENG